MKEEYSSLVFMLNNACAVRYAACGPAARLLQFFPAVLEGAQRVALPTSL
jgi:hypothetical protein